MPPSNDKMMESESEVMECLSICEACSGLQLIRARFGQFSEARDNKTGLIASASSFGRSSGRK